MPKKTVEDIDVKDKRVLLRVDFNVPLNINTGVISDDSRIRASLPTIKYLVSRKARVIICSHLGRPKGKVVESLRMAPIAQRLSELVDLPVITASDCTGPEVESKAGKLKEGDILVLENLRFHPEEEENDAGFARKLAGLADIYVNDAFGTAHRAHASTVGVAKYLPAVAGFLMTKELRVMEKLLHDPERPSACLIGGAKVSDKMELLQNMLKRVDMLLVGGGMAATFLKAEGYEVGHSLVEDDKLELAKKLLQEAKEWKVPFLLPIDAIVAEEIRAGASTRVVPTTNIPVASHIVDIGPKSIALFQNGLKKCRTVMWNGPMGIYEMPQFAQGTRAIASFLSTLDATTIIGGGSSVEVVQEMGLTGKMTHVSTGGGASLRFLEGATLPGVEVLLDRK
ncbi:MAG: phosphoglycerate kinase [Chloroflexi bacterium RBG_13_51_36]|nr:MAG: phosphoglycerate kinase [Chloroflexi bacterium RBG_13_51_36]